MADPTASLEGKRVVVTRAIEQTADLHARLTARGAVPISLPLVSFAPPEDYASLDAALDQLKSFDWMILTSANAVHAVTARAVARNRPKPRTEEMPQVAVVGPATKSEATAAGFPVTYVAKTHLGVALAEELGERLRNKSVFLPRSDRANPDLPIALRRLGANLTEVIAYRTVAPAGTTPALAYAVLDGEADAILFFSPSAVHNFADLAGRVRFAAAQEKLAVIAVGPITASALREIGVHRISIAADTTTAAVVDTLATHFAEAPASKSAPPKSSARAGVHRR